MTSPPPLHCMKGLMLIDPKRRPQSRSMLRPRFRPTLHLEVTRGPLSRLARTRRMRRTALDRLGVWWKRWTQSVRSQAREGSPRYVHVRMTALADERVRGAGDYGLPSARAAFTCARFESQIATGVGGSMSSHISAKLLASWSIRDGRAKNHQ